MAELGAAELVESVVLGVVYLVVGILLFLSMVIWVSRSGRRIKARYGLRGPENNDAFSREHGYSWDFALVLPIYDSDQIISKIQRQFSLRYILEILAREKIESRTCIMSEYTVLVKLRVDKSRLNQAAIENKYMLELDANALRHRCQKTADAINASSEDHKWAPIRLRKDKRFSWLDPYLYCYAPYRTDNAVKSLWRRPSNQIVLKEEYFFRGVDRIRLIQKIIENDCGLALKKLIQEKVLVASFGIHEYHELRSIEHDWRKNSIFSALCAVTPLNQVRDYFGEKIALYIALSEKFAAWLTVLSVLGVLGWVAEISGSALFNLIYGCILALWTTGFALAWQKRQTRLALQYGTLNYQREEKERPEYKQSKNGKIIDSPITGRPQSYFYKSEGNNFDIFCKKMLLFFIWLALVMSLISAQWSLKDCCSKKKSETEYIFALVDAIRVQIFLFLFVPGLADLITNLQNHKTQTQHNDAHIFAVLILRAINAYASLVYVAFIRPFSAQSCAFNDDCLRELRVLFAISLLFRTPFLLFSFHQDQATNDSTTFLQFFRQNVHDSGDASLFTDARLTRLIELIGYLVYFSAAFPPAAFLCLGLAWASNKLDCLALLSQPKRPFPEIVQDLGAHAYAIFLTPNLAIASNAAIIILTGRYVDNLFSINSNNNLATARLLTFLVFEHFLLAARFFLSAFFSEHRTIQLQTKRHEFILSKAYYNVADGDEDDEFSGGVLSFSYDGSDSSITDDLKSTTATPLLPPSYVVHGNDEDWLEIRGATAINNIF